MENFIFIVLFLIISIGAVLVAFARQIVTSLFGLLLTLASLAGLYIFLSADFVAVSQVLIYIGGVVILFLFAIMLTGRTANQLTITNPAMRKIPALFFCAAFFALTLYVIFTFTDFSPSASVVAEREAGVRKIGHLLLTDFVLPFEYVSFLIVALLVGSAVLIRKELINSREEKSSVAEVSHVNSK